MRRHLELTLGRRPINTNCGVGMPQHHCCLAANITHDLYHRPPSLLLRRNLPLRGSYATLRSEAPFTMATPWPTSSSTLTGFFAPDSTLQTMPYPTSEDWQASFISLVSAMATTTSASPAPSNTTMAAAQTGLSTGTVTGIAVGAAISFILVAVMVAVLCLRRRKNGLGRLPSYQEVSGDAQAQGIPRRAVELPAEVPEEWAQRKVTPERVIGADKNSILREITRPGKL